MLAASWKQLSAALSIFTGLVYINDVVLINRKFFRLKDTGLEKMLQEDYKQLRGIIEREEERDNVRSPANWQQDFPRLKLSQIIFNLIEADQYGFLPAKLPAGE